MLTWEPAVERHPGRGVGGHDREAVGGLQLGVHDAVLAGALVAVLPERVDGQLAAEHGLVELQRLAGPAVEDVDIGVEPAGHVRSLTGR